MNYTTIAAQLNQKAQQPKITIPSSAFGALRRELIDTIGFGRSKGFLLRYGWDCGETDALQMMELEWEDQKELLLAGPTMHTTNGHAQVEHTICEVDFDKGILHFEGDWKSSNEAKEHLKLFGKSEEPVCHSLAGYASGYLSTVIGKRVIVKEVSCMATGDEHCHWIAKTVGEWNGAPEIEQESHLYEADRISDELEETYERLRVERDSLSKTYDVHLQLFNEVIFETGLQPIVEILYKKMNIPVLIETLNCEIRAVGGLKMTDAQKFSRELKEWFAVQEQKPGQEKQEIHQTGLLDIAPGHRRIITPIYFRQKIHGYCSFITDKDTVSEVEKMLLGQAALACSLHLLNERTRFITEQRIRGSLLEDLLNKRVTTSEMIIYARDNDFELKEPYFMAALHRPLVETSAEEEIEFNDQFMNDLNKFFQSIGVKGLIGQKSGTIICLFSESAILNRQFDKESFCKRLFQYSADKYPRHLFEIGVSSSYSSLEEAPQLYVESTAALKLAGSQQKLVYFDSLGVVGMLLQTRNPETIERYAHKILGKLIAEDKNMELTNTLYQYLENGSNVHQTARAMNFSVNGLRYRLGKINELLKVNMDKGHNRNEIYVALQCLIVLGILKL